MAKPATPLMIGEVDARLTDVFRMVIEEGLDEDMDESVRDLWYYALRMAYCEGKVDGAKEMRAGILG